MDGYTAYGAWVKASKLERMPGWLELPEGTRAIWEQAAADAVAGQRPEPIPEPEPVAPAPAPESPEDAVEVPEVPEVAPVEAPEDLEPAELERRDTARAEPDGDEEDGS